MFPPNRSSSSGWKSHKHAMKDLRDTVVAVLKVVGIVAGSIVAVLATGLLLLLWSCTPPSLNTLAKRFPSQQHDLKTLITMSNQDSDLLVIDPGWLETSDYHQYLSYDPASGITAERWEAYRRIFRRNGFTQGIRRNAKNGDAFIIVKSIGILDNGYSNGYLYCGPGPVHSYPPCSSNQSKDEHPYSPESEAYSFIKVADHWYVYSQGPG